jgi:hypothetical protein
VKYGIWTDVYIPYFNTTERAKKTWRDLEREKHSFKVSGVSTASNRSQ